MLDLVSCVEMDLLIKDYDKDATGRLLVYRATRSGILEIPWNANSWLQSKDGCAWAGLNVAIWISNCDSIPSFSFFICSSSFFLNLQQ